MFGVRNYVTSSLDGVVDLRLLFCEPRPLLHGSKPMSVNNRSSGRLTVNKLSYKK